MRYGSIDEVRSGFTDLMDDLGYGDDLMKANITGASEGEIDSAVLEHKAVEHKLACFQRLQREAGIPRRYRYARLATCSDVVRDYVFDTRRGIRTDEGCKWLLLAGGPGTGKSYASAAVASDLIDLGCRYTNFSMILGDIRDTFNNRTGAGSERGIVEELCSIPVLIINDFGKDSIESQWALSKVFQILNMRYEEMFATVISTQLNGTELYSYLDIDGTGTFAEAMLSRLAEAVHDDTDGGDKRLRGWHPATMPVPDHEVTAGELRAVDSRYAELVDKDTAGADTHLKAFGWRAVGGVA